LSGFISQSRYDRADVQPILTVYPIQQQFIACPERLVGERLRLIMGGGPENLTEG